MSLAARRKDDLDRPDAGLAGRWRVVGSISVLTLAAVVVVTLSAAWRACPARAASAPDSKFQPNLEATVRYLQKAQQEGGGFAEPGREAGPDFSAWVTLALAAAGINPRDQTTRKQHYQAGHSAFDYLAEHADEASLTTDFERELLVVDAAGTSPEDFGGVDLVEEILKRQITQGPQAGGFPHEAGSTEAGVNDTVFAIIALSPIHEPQVQEAIAKAAEWLKAQQGCDGSWPPVEPRPQGAGRCGPKRGLLPGEVAGEVDMTGAAIEALNAAQREDPEEQAWAFEFLREAQRADGGLAQDIAQSEPNVASTAWAVQAMWSAGINPETWHSGPTNEEPLGYLASMQQEDGHIRYEASREENGMWMTAYVTPAFTGNALPIPEATYEPLPAAPPEEPSYGGNDGLAPGSGSGVGAGGGGEGAKLFSRPQPNSKGHTAGGARLLKSQRQHERHQTDKRNPGRARKLIAPTVTAAKEGSAHDTSGGGLAARAHSGKSDKGGAMLSGAGAANPTRAETEVKGVLIGNGGQDELDTGAPGLRSAGGGEDQGQWLTITICATIALLILTGALIESRRPQTIL